MSVIRNMNMNYCAILCVTLLAVSLYCMTSNNFFRKEFSLDRKKKEYKYYLSVTTRFDNYS